MTIGQQLDSIMWGVFSIMNNPLWSWLVGTLAGIIVLMRVMMNHFDFRKARLVSALAVLASFIFYIVALIIINPKYTDDTWAMGTGLAVLVIAALVFGFFVAAIILKFWRKPIESFKQTLAVRLKNMANDLELSLEPQIVPPAPPADTEYRTFEVIKEVIEENKDHPLIQGMKLLL